MRIFGYYPPKVKIENHSLKICLSKRRFSGNCLSNRQAGRVLTKSLVSYPLVLFMLRFVCSTNVDNCCLFYTCI